VPPMSTPTWKLSILATPGIFRAAVPGGRLAWLESNDLSACLKDRSSNQVGMHTSPKSLRIPQPIRGITWSPQVHSF
jgi:hypothetical protein